MHFRHQKERRDPRQLRGEGWKVGASVLIFFLLSSIIPLYNKVVFNGVAGDRGFPYPVTVAFLQLAFCAVVLVIGDLVRYIYGATRRISRRHAQGNVLRRLDHKIVSIESKVGCDEQERQTLLEQAESLQRRRNDLAQRYSHIRAQDEIAIHDSWLCGPNFWFKLSKVFPIGALFGFKYGVTNWGLHLLPLAPHLLLQATDLMWTVLFARLLARERLSRAELATCLLSTLGTMLVALRTKQTVPDSLYSIAINLVSPILLGMCVSTLRVASRSLLIKHAVIGGRSQRMKPFEMSSLKLAVSSAVIFPFALLFENGLAETILGFAPVSTPSIPAYRYAMTESPALGFAAMGGGLFVLLFQVNMTWLSKMTTAVTVGVVGGLKVLPQWITALVFSGTLDLNPLNLAGAFIILVSSAAWTWLRYDPKLTESNPDYTINQSRISRKRFSSLPSEDVETEATPLMVLVDSEKQYGATRR